MIKQTLYYNSANDPLGRFIVTDEYGDLAMDELDMEGYMRKLALKYLVSKILPF